MDKLAAACGAMFIVVLAIAAYWDPSIRVLHAFEALPLTTFVRNGFERVAMLVTTGHVDRWDQFIAAPAALSTGGLVLFSVWGYSRVRPKRPADLALFVAVLVLVAAFFVGIFWLFTPQALRCSGVWWGRAAQTDPTPVPAG
ncbi:MAG: hypothetical protein ACM4AI_00175 [Acidobacteriota bacterium]